MPTERMYEILAVTIKVITKVSQHAEKKVHFMFQIFGHSLYSNDSMNFYKCSAYSLIVFSNLLFNFVSASFASSSLNTIANVKHITKFWP